jgi:hypothetical protein
MRLLPWTFAAVIGAGQLFFPAAYAQNAPAQPQSPQAQSPEQRSPQVPQAQPPSPGQSDHARNIPDDKLDKEAAAIKSVASVKRSFQQRMAEADESQKERIASEAVDALQKAVTDQGLSIEEYSSILEIAQNDPEVRQKIIQRIRPSDKSGQ